MHIGPERLHPRLPTDQPVTQKQIAFLLDLAPSLDEQVVAKIGKWQASALIDELLHERRHAHDYEPAPVARRVVATARPIAAAKCAGGQWIVLLAVAAGVVWFVYSRSVRSAKEETLTTKSATPLPVMASQSSTPVVTRQTPLAAPPTPSPPLVNTRSLEEQAAYRRAVQRYPELGIAGSPLNAVFLVRYKQLKKDEPVFFEQTEWPTVLAKRCDEYLNTKPSTKR